MGKLSCLFSVLYTPKQVKCKGLFLGTASVSIEMQQTHAFELFLKAGETASDAWQQFPDTGK
jgi:hypothetical protein